MVSLFELIRNCLLEYETDFEDIVIKRDNSYLKLYYPHSIEDDSITYRAIFIDGSREEGTINSLEEFNEIVKELWDENIIAPIESNKQFQKVKTEKFYGM